MRRRDETFDQIALANFPTNNLHNAPAILKAVANRANAINVDPVLATATNGGECFWNIIRARNELRGAFFTLEELGGLGCVAPAKENPHK